MAKRIGAHVSWLLTLEVLIFIALLGGYTGLMVWRIVVVASVDPLDTLNLILTVVLFAVGWLLIATILPFFFWFMPLLIGRKASKHEDPKDNPSDTRTRLKHKVTDSIALEKDASIEEGVIPTGEQIIIVGLGSDYYEAMYKGKRVKISANQID